MPVGVVKDSELCEKISDSYRNNPIVFWQVDSNQETVSESYATLHNIQGSDNKEILNEILNILPNPETIDEKRFAVSV